ncbi:hypothetical protein M446_2767 [Methylobacterium sp. 4-46]|uniref:hypothetical protein n=1 Tax=unclassified Methylobacterium TaxID=2615210 RepID=UPI000152D122|nr:MULTISPECIES: hypothetical protein [Methylobacterium]ACA17205.1 hypothetical protein M446_2767 [Methylobacterium sp. 4-46]WFT82887.1 hypothetical protein QA634_14020 [Methylobacterium nodulans]
MPTDDPREDADQRGRALLALALVAALVLGSVWVFTTLRREAQREDCLAAHRRDCDRLADSP